MPADLDVGLVLFLLAVFFAGGFLDSISGGGGLLTIPALLLTGLPAEVVVGTNKTASLPGIFSALAAYVRGGFVDRGAALRGLPFALLGGLVGSRALLFFDSRAIGLILVFMLPLGIAVTFFPKKESARRRAFSPRARHLRTALVCLVVGLYDGFFGPGSGSFYIMGFYFFLGMGLVQASATIKIFNLAASASASFMFALHGHVLYLLVLPLSLANIAGNLIGARMTMRIGPSFVRRVLGVSLLLLFGSLFCKVFLSNAP
ncbi:MAG: TSUP family transporter [Desulfovibrio sp.]|jgi:uncharacterized membrane protein YfcA|nr:TSUP family transporter [Desulfovibrio sp.]